MPISLFLVVVGQSYSLSIMSISDYVVLWGLIGVLWMCLKQLVGSKCNTPFEYGVTIWLWPFGVIPLILFLGFVATGVPFWLALTLPFKKGWTSGNS